MAAATTPRSLSLCDIDGIPAYLEVTGDLVRVVVKGKFMLPLPVYNPGTVTVDLSLDAVPHSRFPAVCVFDGRRITLTVDGAQLLGRAGATLRVAGRPVNPDTLEAL